MKDTDEKNIVSIPYTVYQYVWVEVGNGADRETIEQEALNMALENPLYFEVSEGRIE